VLTDPDPNTDAVYVTNADDGTLSFLRRDGTTTKTVSVGAGSTPYELDITPRGNSLLVPNYGTGTLLWYTIKTTSLRASGSITLGGTPTAVASIREAI